MRPRCSGSCPPLPRRRTCSRSKGAAFPAGCPSSHKRRQSAARTGARFSQALHIRLPGSSDARAIRATPAPRGGGGLASSKRSVLSHDLLHPRFDPGSRHGLRAGPALAGRALRRFCSYSHGERDLCVAVRKSGRTRNPIKQRIRRFAGQQRLGAAEAVVASFTRLPPGVFSAQSARRPLGPAGQGHRDHADRAGVAPSFVATGSFAVRSPG